MSLKQDHGYLRHLTLACGFKLAIVVKVNLPWFSDGNSVLEVIWVHELSILYYRVIGNWKISVVNVSISNELKRVSFFYAPEKISLERHLVIGHLNQICHAVLTHSGLIEEATMNPHWLVYFVKDNILLSYGHNPFDINDIIGVWNDSKFDFVITS